MLKIMALVNFNLQPTLENEQVVMLPLNADDFEYLYVVASDPKIWEQHPNKDRWKIDVFLTYFEGAMASKGAFKIMDKLNNKILGCSRFYDYDANENSIFIGYTFFATKYWGTGINKAVKKLMLDYIFQYVSKVYFHVGSENKRSQIAMERLGATKINEVEIAYFGEPTKLNFEYVINKLDWMK
jgi:RimJ/RimL family protein N-acetyltransferase